MKKFLCAAFAAVITASGALAFSGCGTAEVQFTLSEDGTYYIVSGVSGSKSALKQFDIPSTYGEEQLPVKVVGDEAFMDCTSLYTVTIPDTVTEIGIRAFVGTKLSQIVIPDSVTTIRYAAFAMCGGLTELTVPESVTVLEGMAFAYCTLLERAYLKCNVENLPDGLLFNTVPQSGGTTYINSRLKEVYISSSVRKINVTALYGNVITDIYFAGTDEQWNELYFYRLEKPEGQEEYTETEYDKAEILSNITVHCNYNF